MVQVRDGHDLPALCEQFKREKFFGEIRLCFRDGRLVRMIQERSFTIEDAQKAGR
jgi:hypothetical protein